MQLEQDPALAPIEMESDDDASFDLVTVLDGRVLEVYNALPEHLLTCSEFELCEKVDPTPSDYKMRQNFHDAVAVARHKGKRLRVTSIYDDVVARQTFFNFYVPSPLKMAFITRPVVGHNQYYDAIFKEGLRKMFLYVRKYDLDPKFMPTFMRIIEKAGDRVIGPVVQKIAMHQKQEITHSSKQEALDVTPEDPVLIKAKIKELQDRMNKVKTIDLITSPVKDDE